MKRKSPPPVMQAYKNGPVESVVDDQIGQVEFTNETLVLSSASIMGGTHQEILIVNIDSSPYQNRVINELSEEFISDLAANIDKDKLNTPILVRKKSNGRYELIAGEHRVEAFKRNGQSAIPAIVKEMDDIAAAKATVLDNVFRKNNSAYELFKGYKLLLDMNAFSSNAQLAKEVNISKSELSRILSFDKLPAEAIEIIGKDPTIIGSNTAYSLSEFSQTYPKLVVEAIEKIRNKTLLQQRAIGWIKSVISPKTRPAARTITDKKGNSIFTVKLDKSGLFISSTKKEISSDIEDKIFELLEKEAQKIDCE